MFGPVLHLGGRFIATAIVNCGGGATCNTGLPTVPASSKNLQHGLEAAFGIIAVVAVVMVVVGGLQFVLAQGDPQTVVRARKTIIYAVVGLVVAVSADVIVGFVLNKL